LKKVIALLMVWLVVGQLTTSTTERLILDEIKLGWATIKITATTRDATVTEKMLFVENARESDVRLYKPEVYHGLIYVIGDVKIISGKYYREPTTSTTTSTTLPPVEYRGCCFEKTCLVDLKKCEELKLKLDCNDDKICETVGGGMS